MAQREGVGVGVAGHELITTSMSWTVDILAHLYAIACWYSKPRCVGIFISMLRIVKAKYGRELHIATWLPVVVLASCKKKDEPMPSSVRHEVARVLFVGTLLSNRRGHITDLR